MRRALAVALALLVVVPSAAVAVPDARLAVSGLTVAPDTPTVGEPVTVTATVRNSAGSNSAVELTAVRLVDGDGTTLATATDPGSLSPGDTLSVDLTRQFETSGVKELAIVAVGEDANDQRVTVRRPVTVTVEGTPPLVSVDAPRLVADSENTLSVQVSNPNTGTYRNLVVRIDAPDAEPKRRVVPSLVGGASTTLNVSYAPAETGAALVDVTVDYTTATGVDRTTEYATTLSVESLREDVGVAVEPAPEQQVQPNPAGGLGGILGGAGGSTLQQSGEQESSDQPDALSVTVTNFGNAPIRDAVVVPRTDDGQLPRVAVGTLAPGEERTVEVSLAPVDGATTVTADVSYTLGDDTGTASGQFDYSPPTGEIRLTGVDMRLADGTVTVTGNAGNVGDGEVTGVVVRVGGATGVEPAYPSRSYFVGTVEGSEFTPFELTADVDPANATAVPVTVTYRVDGEQRTRTVELPLDTEQAAASSDGTGSQPAVVGAAGLGVAVLAGGTVLVARRRR